MNDDTRHGVREHERSHGGPVPEHPAMRDRRRRVARDIGRRRRVRATWLLGVLAAALVGYWLYTGPVLSVNGVTVRGYDRDDRVELAAALSAAAKRGTVLSPPAAGLRTAANRFPWVEDITVARDWPRGLTVDVIQARAVAVGYAGQGDPVLLTRDGRVLEAVTSSTGLGWMRLASVPPAPGGHIGEGEAAVLKFLDALPDDVALQVRDLTLTTEGTVTAHWTRDPSCAWGGPSGSPPRRPHWGWCWRC